MSQVKVNFEKANQLVKEFENVIKKPVKNRSSVYYTGVDLGTACVVLAVLDENYQPVAGAYRYASVVRDGMVVDFVGAMTLVREMKEELEEKLGTDLLYASAAVPPGTEATDAGAIKHVVEGAGFEITALLDEPTAANAVLEIGNGAIVDIGGGTTGITTFREGEILDVSDEATGGTHFTLVISGAYQMEFEKAEAYKKNPENHKELVPTIFPVVDKVASIIKTHVADQPVQGIYLVGGTCCFTGIEKMIEKATQIPTFKPDNPLFVTSLGIAMHCTQTIL